MYDIHAEALPGYTCQAAPTPPYQNSKGIPTRNMFPTIPARDVHIVVLGNLWSKLDRFRESSRRR